MKKNYGSSDQNLEEISQKELSLINGGGFAYDFGFMIRTGIIGILNGCGSSGLVAQVTDISINYKPL